MPRPKGTVSVILFCDVTDAPRGQSAPHFVTTQLPARNVKVTPAGESGASQSHAEAHMANVIASYIALPITTVIAIAVIIYLLVQLRRVGEKDNEL